MNLLMMAPLYDNRGSVRYFLGAQVDVSGLVEEGRGLETFARYIEDKSHYGKRDNEQPQESASKRSLRTLNEFGQMLSLDESAIFQSHSRCSSVHSAENGPTMSFHTRGAPPRRDAGIRYPRKVLGHDETHDEDDRNAWAFSSIGPSGKLPGVYQNVSCQTFLERRGLDFLNAHLIIGLTGGPAVSPRPSVPVASHHLCFPGAAHSRSPSITISVSHWRPGACT